MYKTVCLVNPPWVQRQQSIWENVEGRTLPFGLGYVAAVLERDSRADVSIVDAKADELTPEKTVQKIVETSPDVVGMSSCTYNYPDALTLARMVREKAPDAITCFGGFHASVLPELTLKTPWVDFVVRGEGEYTFLELIKGIPPQQIKGLSYKHRRKIVHNPDRPLMENLDELPRLSYHLLPMEKYYPTAGQCRRLPATAMVVSRGCPGVCIFCCSSVTGRHVRRFSPERILNEVQFLVENYGVREIVFMDDTMTHPREEMVHLCSLLTQKELGVIWDCSTRVTAVDQSLLKLMKKAGCNQISFGIESGDDTILKSIRKGHRRHQVEKAVALAKKAGLEVRGSFILGFPEDTEETMKKTIAFSRGLGLDLASFYIATPYPGTDMFEWAESNNRLLTKDWSLYDQSHCIMDIPYASSETVRRCYIKAWRSFYWRPSYLLKRGFKMRSATDVVQALRAVKGVVTISERVHD